VTVSFDGGRELSVLLEVLLRIGRRHLLHHGLGADQANEFHLVSFFCRTASINQ
jgi:hypothetical protein